ncbi:DUF928 domain-containing protein [Spirulina subsalsa]|uniref:DUF928 domain-containing protein n=1 Tax=Spirulina subsalsa TaxID=54311 RepID=UPI0013DEA505|nr:DUF928 domain-containing protein [Spirulina subsalsa]
MGFPQVKSGWMGRCCAPLLMSLSLIAPAMASPGLFPLQVSVNFPNAPAGSGSPSRTAGGATRTGQPCVPKGPNDKPLTVIVPSNNVGKTVAAEPTLFLYVPPTTAVGGEVVILDEAGEEVYFNDEFTLPESLKTEGGIVRFQVTGADLQAGQKYEWIFSLMCNVDDRSNDEVVTGVFERVESNLATPSPDELGAAELASAATRFAQAGIWNETLIYAAQLREFNAQEWANLLSAVELEDLANIPFAN